MKENEDFVLYFFGKYPPFLLSELRRRAHRFKWLGCPDQGILKVLRPSFCPTGKQRRRESKHLFPYEIID